MRVLAGIVTYEPDLERLKKCIAAVLPQTELVVIFDNGSSNVGEVKCLINDNAVLIESPQNKGIAHALNQIFHYAENNGYDWVLTLDQDSICSPLLIDKLKKNIHAENVGIVCPIICDLNVQKVMELVAETKVVDKCITSGSLSSVRAWNRIGGFDERMFIDGVDFDYCIRLKQEGYEIYLVKDAVLMHEIGHIEKHRVLFFEMAVMNHSSFRKYYIAKNIVYLDRKHHLTGYPVKTFLRVFKQLLLVWLFEQDKKEKMRRIVLGALDGSKERIDR